ncbi:MAG: calcium/sodium antiporter [Clostridia bacterium]|nr:calcium/sodium antiporter [Clostridia bacterium]
MFITILLLLAGLALLIKGGDWFVDGATCLARRFHLPELLIGATVVSIGTTLPEVMVSAGAAIEGQGDIAYGNAIGSIICNTALIAALTIAIKPCRADRKSLIIPSIFFFGAAAIYIAVSYITGDFSRWVGIILLGVFVTYMTVTVLRMKKAPAEAHDDDDAAPAMDDASYESLSRGMKLWAQISGKRTSVAREIILLVVGAVAIKFGADFLIDSGTEIATKLGVPQTVIGLTIVAIGTSLPELVTAITSLIKGHGALSLGNIIGANIFNLVLVSGMAITIAPFSIPASSTLFGYNTSLIFDIPIMLGVMGILIIPTLLRGKLSRVQGIGLLAIYAAFLVVQIAFCVPA